jgi:hypothetical protein
MQYIEDDRKIQCIEDGQTIQYKIEDGQTIQYNILKMVRQYNTIYLRWSDNTIQYIEDFRTIKCNILKMVRQYNTMY